MFFVIFIFGLLGKLRGSSLYNAGVVDIELMTEFNLQSAADSTTKDRARLNEVSGQIAVMHAVPDSVPHLYGTSYVSALACFVPRTIWPNKPRGGGAHVGAMIYSEMSSTSDYTGAGYPLGGAAEAYWNFGVPGVMLVYVLFGLLRRIVTDSFLRRPGDPFRALVLLVSMTVLVDASSDSIVKFLFR